MTQEELLEYNKRCAEFLGAIYSKHAEAWGFGNAKNIGSKMFHGIMYENVIQAERFEKELKFDTDWNWIMEVVEAIEKLELGDVKIPITWSSMHQGVTHAIEEYYDATVVVNINHSNCIIDIVGTMRLRNDFIVVDNLSTKKEAVVEAINQFLIWYKP